MDKILIIRLSSIGDIILTTPLVRAVRHKYPKAQIDFLIKIQFSSLLQCDPHLSNLITFDKEKDDIKELKSRIVAQQYDWIIDIHKNFRSFFLTRRTGAKLITRYRKHIFKRQLLVWLGMNTFSKDIPVIERYFDAVNLKGISYDRLGTEIHFSEKEANEAESLLREEGFEPIMDLIAICPGASFANKRWISERFTQLADKLAKERNAQIVLLGGPEDKELCNEIKANMSAKAFNLAGALSLLGSAAMLSRCAIAVTNDTGLMHMAQSQSIPVVAIFGPTTKELGYFPIPIKSAVVRKEMKCQPCTHNGLDKCPKGHFNCMKQITSDMVFRETVTLLSDK